MLNISNPIYKICIEGRHFLAFPVYVIKQPRQVQSIESQEQKLEEVEVNRESNIEKQQEKSETKIIFNDYMFPGLSKNYYKNIGNNLSQFIISNFDIAEIREDRKIQKFLKIGKQNYNKKHIQQLIKSRTARQIVRMYFGNFLWCSSILKQMRSDVEFYINLNRSIFKRKIKNKHSLSSEVGFHRENQIQ
ncbi:unnamed protein product [Paramecium sonneborni]|uniref:Uncharacterized protein n=1 Tax=Paramecium sonneborni TaxID=65129 RepID=A0A8S1KHU2_9CILI|nr:unnamed protein product [Paramecium sonneborni]